MEIDRIGIFIAVLMLSALLCSCAPKPVIRDFESGNFRGWYRECTKSHSCLIVTDPVRKGKYAARFELRHDDPKIANGHRSEVSENYFLAPFNKDIWYRFSTFIPKDWPHRYVRCLIAQWHGFPDKEFGEVWRSPVLGIEYRDMDFMIRICYSSKSIQTTSSCPDNNKTILYRSDEYAQKGIWHDFVVNVNWTYKRSGYLNVWIDDNQVIKYKGPIGYNDFLGTFFKMGIYRDNIAETFVIYHDEYRRGYSPADIGIENFGKE